MCACVCIGVRTRVCVDRDIPGGCGSDAERDRDMCYRDKPGGWVPKTPMSRVTSFTDAP